MVTETTVGDSVDGKVEEMEEKKGPARIDVESESFRKAGEAARGIGASLMEKLAEQIGANAGVRAVFGEPIEKNGRTVVPVAQSMWGSGAGTGESDEDGSGSGGGGGAVTRPLGFIEITDNQAAYVPISKPWQDARLILAYAFAVWLVSRALNRLLRG